MSQFHITGMSCAACSARIESAVKMLPGVERCSVNLLTNSMVVEGPAPDEKIIKAVTDAGYGASVMAASLREAEKGLADTETPYLKKRLFVSLFFLVILLYIAMGHGMWGWPLLHFLEVRPILTGILQAVLAGIIILINQQFFISGMQGVTHKAPNMNTLVALGSGAAYLYSFCVLIIMMGEQEAGHYDLVAQHLKVLYFDSAAMILVLITVGKLLEAYSKGRTTNALKSLISLSPREATVVRGEEELKIPVDRVIVGDIFYVKPGETVPVDGIVLEGISAVNEAALTGESMPVDVQPGSRVKSASINCDGMLTCKALRVGEDTTLARIIKLVSDASASKAPIAKTADRVAAVFVPVVLVIALVTLIVWMLAGRGVGYALARAISVLVISCPCAMGLATPVAIMVGSGVGARNGILYKTAASMETAGKADRIALDKTGTVTKGQPVVVSEVALSGSLHEVAGALEACSEHPLAAAVTAYTGVTVHADSFRALPGNGVEGMLNGVSVCGGSYHYIRSRFILPAELEDAYLTESKAGHTPLFFAQGNDVIGMIAVADTIKEESPQTIRELKALGLEVFMLTGDNERTASAIGKESGVDSVIAGVLPEGKEQTIRELQGRSGTEFVVAMVGDGINDAPALTRADVGIAIGAGADVAVDAADVVLMKGDLRDVAASIRLSRAVLRNIRQNLFWAFIYNMICIPLAAGVYSVLFGWTMNPMIAAACMSVSSICVVLNALRLNLVKPYDARHDKAPVRRKQKREVIVQDPSGMLIRKESEDQLMKKNMQVEGMMCTHCEAFVVKTLETIPGVLCARADHTTGLVEMELSEDIADEILAKAVTEAGYTVKG